MHWHVTGKQFDVTFFAQGDQDQNGLGLAMSARRMGGASLLLHLQGCNLQPVELQRAKLLYPINSSSLMHCPTFVQIESYL